MSTVLGEAPPIGPVDFEAWFAMGDDGGSRRREVEPHPVSHLVGRAIIEEQIFELEERWLRGQPMTQREQDLLALAGEDLRSEYHR
jgi:hypothetical protein